MIARIVSSESASQHLHRFSPRRDLESLADLIQESFGDDLALTGSRMVQDLRNMATWGGAISLAHRISPVLDGFVWIENDRVVGNVTLLRDAAPGTYVISNVSVSHAWRGRGIASELVDQTVQEVRRAGGTRILLQVRDKNVLAQELYRRRGFERFDALHELNLRPGRWPTVVGAPGPGFRGVRARDSASVYDLVAASTLPSALRCRPPRRQSFQRGLLWQAQRLLELVANGRDLVETIAVAEGRIVAYGCIKTNMWRGPHELSVHVLPSDRGYWEDATLTEVFRLLSRASRYSVRCHVSASHPEALEATARLGFETLRVLDQMCLDL